MTGLPEELIFLLIVGFIVLAQFLRRQRRPPTAAEQAERATEAVRVANEQPLTAPRLPTLMPNLAEALRQAPAPGERSAANRSSRAVAAPLSTSPRRYARQSLMGNRRAVQNAFVVATVLQPCRARRPYGTEQ